MGLILPDKSLFLTSVTELAVTLTLVHLEV